MFKTSKIYIAGHNGMVGSAIWRKLKNEGYDNLIGRSMHELDLTHQSAVNKFFESERPEYVFLSAARVGGIFANNEYRAEFIYQNLAIQTNIIHASHVYGVRKLLFLGSSCIYPKMAPHPIKEEYLLTGSLEPTNEPYAIAKIAGLKMCEAYKRQYGDNFISAMPTNLYGKNDRYEIKNSHVLPALIQKFHLAKLVHEKDIKKEEDRSHIIAYLTGNDAKRQENEKIFKRPSDLSSGQLLQELASLGITEETVEIWGTGTPRREFLNVDDCASAIVFLMKNYNDAEHINVGSGIDISIRELAELVKEIVGFEGELCFNSSYPDGTPRKLLDVSKIRALGWTPTISLEEGVKSAYEWYKGKMNVEKV